MTFLEFEKKLRDDYNLFSKLNLPNIHLKLLDLLKHIKLDDSNKIQIINFWLCVFVSQFRFKIKDNYSSNLIPINYFGYIFAPSGTGKDLTFDTISSLFKPALEEIDILKYNENPEYNEELPNIALGFSTPEGINKVSNELHSNFTIGENYIFSSEFIAEYQKNINADNTLSFLIEIFSNGNKYIKQIKDKNNQLKAISGVGISALFQSDISSLYSDYNLIIKLKNIFSSGLARRSNISIQRVSNTENYNNIDLDNLFAQIKETTQINELKRKIELYFKQLVHKFYIKKQNIITLSQEANECYKLYSEYCKYKVNYLIDKNRNFKINSLVAINYRDNYFRALKLAGALSLLMLENEISKDSLVIAINIIEYLNNGMKDFEEELNKDIFDIFIDYITYNNSKESIIIHTNELIKNNFLKIKYSKNDLEILAINATQRDNNGMYVVDNNSIIYTPLKNNDYYYLSVKNISNILKEQRGNLSGNNYELKKFNSFDSVKEVLCNDTIYCSFKLKDGIRTTENIIPETNLLIFDMDLPYISAFMMHSLLNDINHHIALTSNVNNIYKFRIIIELDKIYTIKPIYYKRVIEEINKQYLFGFTTDLLPITQCYYGYKDREVLSVINKSPISIKNILSKVISNYKEKIISEKERKELLLPNNLNNSFYWAFNAEKGSRNKTLIKVINAMYSLGASKKQTLEFIKKVNISFTSPLDENYLNKCIYPHLDKKYS